ncbi:hypothetical protein I3252_11305 [Psychrobacter sp. Ps4]|uniref:hypothetical protein n=1 Tax=Psychrobacter sp. Ps4 TaxID=2790958 RepID=UPI001EE0364D|nr:hypothetical protein [Psychrobacter sp. Ps4]MCG3810065.1 hypothetical protein [Psychrobacter sp. Ps4]
MKNNNEILEPCLVAVDSHTLSVVDDYIQSYSSECESLGYALNALNKALADDPTSKGVLTAVQSALFRISLHAEETSEGIMEQLILAPEIKVDNYE